MGTCFLYGNVGAGTALNFNVVGGTVQPTDPKDNTIWIDTDKDISGWVFSATQPVPKDGLVWVWTGDVSAVRFNALRKNTIMVYAYSAYQYFGGEWVSKSAYIWDRAWVRMAGDLTIYNSGNAYVTLILNNAVYEEDKIKATIPPSGSATIFTEEAIDMTSYKKVSVTYSDLIGEAPNNSCQIKLQAYDEGGTTTATTAYSSNRSGTLVMDVTSLTGKHSIRVLVGNTSLSVTGRCSITKILMASGAPEDDPGKITFSSFEVDDNGHLWIIDADQTSGAGFALDEESGNLEVTYG